MADRLLAMKDFAATKEFTRSKDLKETDVIEYMI
jgi:ribose transport system ATP-binding protein